MKLTAVPNQQNLPVGFNPFLNEHDLLFEMERDVAYAADSREFRHWASSYFSEPFDTTLRRIGARGLIALFKAFCAGAILRQEPPKEATTVSRRERKPRGFYARGDNRVISAVRCKDDPREFLMVLLETCTARPVTKSELLKFAESFYFDGFASSYFISMSNKLRKEFDELVADGRIKYERGKPLEVGVQRNEACV